MHLRALANNRTTQLPWRPLDKLQGFVALVLLTLLAVSFESIAMLGWWFWAYLAVAGVTVLADSIIASAVSIVRYSIAILANRKVDATADAQV